MEIRQLKYFLKGAETLNFSEASRKLYITQSTLSQQISHLEQEIGLPLFERNSHEVYLTEAGKELLPYAQNAVNCTMACVDHMNDLKEMLTGELNIGVTYSFSNIMAETLIAFLHAYPHVKLNIQYRSMQELMDGLKKRELDLVLAFKPIKTDKAIDSRAIFSNRLAAIVNENHPHTRLHFFWDQPDAPEELKVDDTLTFHRINDEKFLKMMAGCKAFATTAGFESVCEALYMGKPCMLIPAHVEQECNAIKLKL